MAELQEATVIVPVGIKESLAWAGSMRRQRREVDVRVIEEANHTTCWWQSPDFTMHYN